MINQSRFSAATGRATRPSNARDPRGGTQAHMTPTRPSAGILAPPSGTPHLPVAAEFGPCIHPGVFATNQSDRIVPDYVVAGYEHCPTCNHYVSHAYL